MAHRHRAATGCGDGDEQLSSARDESSRWPVKATRGSGFDSGVPYWPVRYCSWRCTSLHISKSHVISLELEAARDEAANRRGNEDDDWLPAGYLMQNDNDELDGVDGVENNEEAAGDGC